MEQPLNLRSFPRAILHVDADSFFASCEQALHKEYRGKPIITGKERGIASAVSIEAKKLGIKRGMSVREIKEIYPNIIHLPSDYETYSLFSKRMFEIVRRYTNVVEEYSIDECFAEITGLRRPLRMSYTQIVAKIKHDLDLELGMTFSIGLAPSKVVAKIGSKWNKPSGLTVIAGKNLHIFLKNVHIQDVWGIGDQTTKYMQNFGIKTALDFARKDFKWVESKFTKPHQEIWHELRGNAVLALETEEKHDYKSISKTKTFTPATSDLSYILAQLSKNTENACIKARRHNLSARRVFFIVRTQDYKHYGYEIKLSRASNLPNEIFSVISDNIKYVYNSKTKYRLTGIVLADLQESIYQQTDLFGGHIKVEKIRKIYERLDLLSSKFGKHTVFLGSSFGAMKGRQHKNQRAELANRKTDLFKGEGERKRIGIPMLGEVD
jgi:DNA polymerase IV